MSVDGYRLSHCSGAMGHSSGNLKERKTASDNAAIKLNRPFLRRKCPCPEVRKAQGGESSEVATQYSIRSRSCKPHIRTLFCKSEAGGGRVTG